MIWKLQKKTLIPTQIVSYFFTLLIGATIILFTTQLYYDVQPLLHQSTDVFKDKAAVVSKQISIFKTVDKKKIYFKKDEIKELREQDFVKSVSKFNNATFKIRAFTKKKEGVPPFYTDLFFESIPTRFIDVDSEEWVWEEDSEIIPIIIPENYINLYNFGFAESQGLPVISKTTITQIEFNIALSGNGKKKEYKSKIVGFSNKINSILVPDKFLKWANEEFGRKSKSKTSRILIEFENPADERITKFFNERNYSINKDKLEFSKLIFFFKSAFVFVFFIAGIIVLLSIGFIILSVNLIIQKNKDLFINLYYLGYSTKKIAVFYQVLVSIISLLSIVIASIVCSIIRNKYIEKIQEYVEMELNENILFVFALVLLTIILIVYNSILYLNIRKVVSTI